LPVLSRLAARGVTAKKNWVSPVTFPPLVPPLGQSSPAPNPKPLDRPESEVASRTALPSVTLQRQEGGFKDVIDVMCCLHGEHSKLHTPFGCRVLYSLLFCSKEGGARSESGPAIPPRSCGVEGLAPQFSLGIGERACGLVRRQT
jgi:hypothetical protein